MKRFYLGALLASAMITAGCNSSPATAPAQPANTAAPVTNTAAPAPAPAPTGTTAPTADASGTAQQNFSVVNNTGHVVMLLNVSASNDNNWGPDVLGSSVIGNGETAQVTFPRAEAQCLWDIRATYDDGDTSELRAVNLCEVGTVTLTP